MSGLSFGRRLGHRDRIGGREGLLQPFLQLALERPFGFLRFAGRDFVLLDMDAPSPLATTPIGHRVAAGAHKARPRRRGRHGRPRSRPQGSGIPAGQPLRHLAAQHAGLAERARPLPVITSSSRASRACALRRKLQQRRMRLRLRQPVQIEPGVDRLLAARDALLHAAAERRQRRRHGFCPARGCGALTVIFARGGATTSAIASSPASKCALA